MADAGTRCACGHDFHEPGRCGDKRLTFDCGCSYSPDNQPAPVADAGTRCAECGQPFGHAFGCSHTNTPAPVADGGENDAGTRCATCGMTKGSYPHDPDGGRFGGHVFAPTPAPVVDGVGPFDIYPEHAAIRPTVEVERPAKAVADGGEKCPECGFTTPCGMEMFPAHQRRAEIAALRAERDRLRRVIEMAPHDEECDTWANRTGVARDPCSCWKRDAMKGEK